MGRNGENTCYRREAIKYIEVQKALEYSGVREPDHVRNQEDGFSLIYESIKNGTPYDAVVTDMQYPLEKGTSIDKEAGFKLIERLKKEGINIPVIICSQSNFFEPEAFGTVWYDDRRDLNADFKVLIDKLRK